MRFVWLAAGRLGLYAGEIAHFWSEWLDWDRMLLRVSQHKPCECGYCRRQASQETIHNKELTQKEATEARWHPKTVASARSIPVDLSLRLELCLERFTDQYEEFLWSRIQPTDECQPLPRPRTLTVECIYTVFA